MNKKRCAFVAAAVLAVCTVAFLCRNRPAVGTEVSASAVQAVAQAKAADPVQPVPAAVAALPMVPSNQTATVRGTKPYVLASEEPFQKPLRLVAESLGARTLGVLSANELLIEATAETRARLAADGRFSSVSEFLPSSKIAAPLAAAINAGAKTVEAAVITLTAEDRLAVKARIESRGGEILKGCLDDDDSFRARMPAELVAELSGYGDVRWMEVFTRPHLMNDVAVEPITMNIRSIWKSGSNPLGLSGDGQSVSTSDSGIDTGDTRTMHADLADRVQDIKVVSGCNVTDVNGHGTHTAGSIVGNGKMSDGKIRGTAWGAHLYAWFCGGTDGYVYTPSSLDELFRNNGDWSAYIHSASWGSSTAGEYTSRCVKMDQYVWQHPDFLPVYAAGNDGDYGIGTIGDPAVAKNVLAVGATQNWREGYDGGWGNGDPTQIAPFSSRGPCQDGRIKPDVSSPGVGVLSTRSHGVNYSYGIYDDYYAYDTGTSMATPLTAGSVALIREWLTTKGGFEDVDGYRPTAALMKAVIMGGAKDCLVPNNNFGAGRTDIAETLCPSDRALKLVDRIPYKAGEKITWLFEVTNSAPLDVQLVWVDYPGSASGSQTSSRLVNNLDLTVESLSDATVYLGNGGKTADMKNNAEVVRLGQAEPGWYRVTVDCRTVVYDCEEGGAAAIYMRGAFDPDAFDSSLDKVSIRETGVRYESFVDALIAGAPESGLENPTFDILQPAELPFDWTIGYDCTICSTNADPRLTPIKASGILSVDRMRVLFTNVVFTGNAPSIRVMDGGTAALAGSVGLNGISLEGSGRLEMAAALDTSRFYRVTAGEGHRGRGEMFGIATGMSLEEAQTYASLFLNDLADELVGVAVDDGNGGIALKWEIGSIPDSAAAARLLQDGESINFASLKTLFKYVTNSAEIVVLTNCVLDGSQVLTNRAITIRSECGAKVTPVPETDSFASFALGAGGELTLSNVVFSGFSRFGDDKAFVTVDAGAKFTLLRGAELRGIQNSPYGAVIVKKDGSMAMCPGSVIAGCTASESTTGTGWGGGIYLNSGANLALDGATITGCQAEKCGGGVYVNANAKVTLTGATTVERNVQSSGFGGAANSREDDIYIDSAFAMPLTVKDGLTGTRLGGSIGVRRKGDENPDGDDVEGEEFANLAEGMDSSAKETAAAAFFCDEYHDYFTGLVGGVEPDFGETLVWARTKVKPGSVPEAEGEISVQVGNVTNYFKSLAAAFASVATDEVARVTLLTNVLIDAEVAVRGDVTLTGGQYGIYRLDNYRITVSGAGNSLCLTNVTVNGVYFGDWITSTCTLFRSEDGGTLILDDGAVIQKLRGFSTVSRTEAAVSVHDGLLTMRDGSIIQNCKPDDEDYICAGGGVIVAGTNAVFRFEGGTITDCAATTGGGVQIENRARFIVSGDGRIVGNLTNNLYVADLCEVTLADRFTGLIGHSHGKPGQFTNPNVFGAVSEEYAGTLVDLAPSATNFFKDADQEVTGRIVTNDTRALLVWSSAIDEKGRFIDDRDGSVYGEVVGGSPVPPPPPPGPQWEVVTNQPTPIAFKSIDRVSDTEWTLVITDRVEYCNYRLLWTTNLVEGFISTGAWEHAVGPAADPIWTTNVITTGGAWFWRAEGTEGTNMVLKVEK